MRPAYVELSDQSPVTRPYAGKPQAMRPDWLQVQALAIPRGSVKQLPEVYRRTVYAVSRRIGDELPTYIERTIQDFWLKRYRQYQDSERFITRVADAFNLSEQRVIDLQRYLNLPNPSRTTQVEHCSALEDSFTSCLYLSEYGVLTDPVDSFYSQFMRNTEYRESCNDYFSHFGYRTIESVDLKDLRYVIREYRLSILQISCVFQVCPDQLKEYIASQLGPLPYSPLSGIYLHNLLQHPRHTKLTKLIIASAHHLYVEQGIPLRVIARRLAVDRAMLFDLGEAHVGEWSHPAFETLVHVIEHCTRLHVDKHILDNAQRALFS